MTEPKPPRTAKPGTLLSQWWTLGAIACDKRTTGRHVKVAWVIIDRFMQKHGAGRASLRYIEKATGLDRKAVIRACRELVQMGYVTQHLGSGTRPSEYTPKWATAHPSGVQMTTTKVGNLSGVEMTTTVVVKSTPLDGASGVQMTTESDLLSPAEKPADSVSVEVSAPAPAADAPGGSGFDRVWLAYGRYGSKQASRKSFDAIPEPDVDLIAARAASWAASAKPGQRRMPLERWLAAEKYDEADRAVAAKPGRVSGTATIRAVTESGSPFTNLYADIALADANGRETTRRLHVGELGDDGPDVEIYRGLLRAAPNGKLAGWQVDATTLAPIAPPADAVTAEPAPRPVEPEPEPGPRQKRPKPKIRRREMTRDEEREWLRAKIADGLFKDGVA